MLGDLLVSLGNVPGDLSSDDLPATLSLGSSMLGEILVGVPGEETGAALSLGLTFLFDFFVWT